MTTTDGGTFGYMFHGRGFDAHSEAALRKLAGLMVSPASPPPAEGGDDPEVPTQPIPAGYTYLGQFIDHDLIFDETSSLTQLNDLNALKNTRTPRFDLDSVYGPGPTGDPSFFEHSPTSGRVFRLGATVSGDPRLEGPDLLRDPRDSQGRPNVARIGDRRNDENLIISQLHALWLRFHNTMAGRVAAARPTLTGDALFEEVRRQVLWHYQWVVVHDFLPRIVGQPMVDRVMKARPSAHGTSATPRRHFDPRPRVFIPVEFSAAYRFGHSMIRPVYRINAKIRVPIFTSNFATTNLENLLGFRPWPREWGFQWKYFFELGGNPPGQPMQKARRIDPQLVNPLETLAPRIVSKGGPPSLAERNLLRGRALGVLSGQEVARVMGLSPIEDNDLIVGPHGGPRVPIAEVAPEFKGNAPLWYYILREAEMEHHGNQLGAVGGRIVTEVFVGLLEADPTSYVSINPTWTPDPALAPGGRFGIPELIRATAPHQ